MVCYIETVECIFFFFFGESSVIKLLNKDGGYVSILYKRLITLSLHMPHHNPVLQIILQQSHT